MKKTSTPIVRVYPIRKNTNGWNIPLYCYHKCNKNCSYIYQRNGNTFTLNNNPSYIDGKCQHNNKLENTIINISRFNLKNPMGNTGPLYEPKMKIIDESEFDIIITYPLTYQLKVNIKNNSGFSIQGLLYLIKYLYINIYEIEEETAEPQTYNLQKSCINCISSDYTKYITDTTQLEEEKEDCSICQNIFDTGEILSSLKCEHIFHKQCIYRWLNKSLSCPLCRYKIIECNDCDGLGKINYTYTGIVIPMDLRGNIINRNRTNGIFGIYGHDVDDLYIEKLYYNRLSKTLYMNIGS